MFLKKCFSINFFSDLPPKDIFSKFIKLQKPLILFKNLQNCTIYLMYFALI